MSDVMPLIVDLTGQPFAPISPAQARPARDWPPITITREMIDAQIEHLADLPRPARGRRPGLFVHPSATQRKSTPLNTRHG